ncbi:hypothetical protein V6N13_078782 [Hibiscus sabdariffa]
MEGSNQNSGLDSSVSSLSLNDDAAGNRNPNSIPDANVEGEGVNGSREFDHGLSMPTQSMEELNDKEKEVKEPKTSLQKTEKYFFYDSPVAEDTGVWIPVSVPPMLEAITNNGPKVFLPMEVFSLKMTWDGVSFLVKRRN